MRRIPLVFSVVLCFFQMLYAADRRPTGSTAVPAVESAGTVARPAAPVEGRLVTRWAKDVTSSNVHPEYPRPQMMRKEWTNLNGLWDYAIRAKEDSAPDTFDGKILVPFAIESQLSGVTKPVGPQNRLWYRRLFAPPKIGADGRLLLHFGAVDWDTTVFVNGRNVGEHKGGYDAFTFDITDALTNDPLQELVLSVWDPTDTWTQPRGKQVSEPGGIWYTSVTGIWRTVWLEPVPATRIESFQIVPDIDKSQLRLTVQVVPPKATGVSLSVEAIADDHVVSTAKSDGRQLVLTIEKPRLWSPDAPFLYRLRIRLQQSGRIVDEVESYAGLRKISLGKDAHGNTQLFLNNKRLFQLGPLDQGWWPDGLYTAPTDEALRYDIEVTKRLGFNMIRKHVKVEPDRWYYWCDKLGMLVWQDMPSGNLRRGQPNNLRVGPTDPEDAHREPESAQQFDAELEALIQTHFNHPSIVMWVPFNEGWGQFDTRRIAKQIRQLDATRLVDSVSGWTDRGAGNVRDVHAYPGPSIEPAGAGRAAVLGEFGGLGWPVPDHLWWNKRNWGYRTYSSREELGKNYARIVGNVYGLLGFGLAAAVYTQTTDVEGEINGLMTYDREVLKFDPSKLRPLHSRLYAAIPEAHVLLTTSQPTAQNWKLTRKPPSDRWNQSSFDDGAWETTSGPFQGGDIPYLSTGAKWGGNTLWLRRTFKVAAIPSSLWMQFYLNVTSAEVFLNGRLVVQFENPRPTGRHYQHMQLGPGADLLKPGGNVIAIHCTKTAGQRAIDVGLYGLK